MVTGPNKSGKSSSHGAPLGDEEIKLVRKKLKWGNDPFVIPEDIKEEWIKIGEKGAKLENKWNEFLEKKGKIKRRIRKYLHKL